VAGREQRCVVGIIPWGPCALSLEVAILARERHMQVADEYVAWIGYSRGGAAEGTEAAAHRFWEKVKGEGVGCPPARARAACLAACTHTRWGAGVGCCCLGAVGAWIGMRGSFGNGFEGCNPLASATCFASLFQAVWMCVWGPVSCALQAARRPLHTLQRRVCSQRLPTAHSGRTSTVSAVQWQHTPWLGSLPAGLPACPPACLPARPPICFACVNTLHPIDC
jgi:hypothetical protein